MFTARDFRDVLGTYPTGVTVATACLPDGQRVGVTVNSFTSVSLEPPLVLFCLHSHSLALPVFRQAGGYGISILAKTQEEVSRRFAQRGQMPERWEGLALHTAPQSGAPLLVDALAWLDCRLEAVHEAGDHHILIGRVQALGRQEAQPLLYWRAGYHQLAEE